VDVELDLVRADPERQSTVMKVVAVSPLPDLEDAAVEYARDKFDDAMEYASCRRGYLAGYVAVPEGWSSGDALPDAWNDADFRETAFSLDGLRGLSWIEAFEEGSRRVQSRPHDT
jgi:hypothetical protein